MCGSASGQIRPDDLGHAVVWILGAVVSGLFARFVEAPVFVNVGAGPQGAKLEHGFGSAETRAGPRQIPAILDEVATRHRLAAQNALQPRAHPLLELGAALATQGVGGLPDVLTDVGKSRTISISTP
jgi:hypothetical protein